MRVSLEDLRRGCEAYEQNEGRDAMYKVAREIIDERWGNAQAVTDALGVLLLTWNQAFYRYGMFDFGELEGCLGRQREALAGFRRRSIASFGAGDEASITAVFNDLLEALKVTTKAGESRRSPVAVVKVLHLLAPEFFPLWDVAIATKGYGCRWPSSGRAAEAYLRFMREMEQVLDCLAGERPLTEIAADLNSRARFPKPLLKLLDQYNYAKFTRHWIE